jgi:hypothetical protein
MSLARGRSITAALPLIPAPTRCRSTHPRCCRSKLFFPPRGDKPRLEVFRRRKPQKSTASIRAFARNHASSSRPSPLTAPDIHVCPTNFGRITPKHGVNQRGRPCKEPVARRKIWGKSEGPHREPKMPVSTSTPEARGAGIEARPVPGPWLRRWGVRLT